MQSSDARTPRCMCRCWMRSRVRHRRKISAWTGSTSRSNPLEIPTIASAWSGLPSTLRAPRRPWSWTRCGPGSRRMKPSDCAADLPREVKACSKTQAQGRQGRRGRRVCPRPGRSGRNEARDRSTEKHRKVDDSCGASGSQAAADSSRLCAYLSDVTL